MIQYLDPVSRVHNTESTYHDMKIIHFPELCSVDQFWENMTMNVHGTFVCSLVKIAAQQWIS